MADQLKELKNEFIDSLQQYEENNMLTIIADYENGAEASVMSLPKEWMDQVEVDAEGNVNCYQLLQVMERYYESRHSGEVSFDEHLDIMDAIYSNDNLGFRS